jgi:tetratricopeptide (TPR) repeat protein
MEATGTLEVALAHAGRLLTSKPDLAAAQANEILQVVPGYPPARLLLAQAHRVQGHWSRALALLVDLVATEPRWAAAHLEMGQLQAYRGQTSAAISALRESLRLKADQPDAWRLLADQLDMTGETVAAEDARARFIKSANRDPQLMAAATALVDNQIPEAEALLRAHLKVHDTDVAALRMLAEVAARLRRYGDSEALLARCLSLAPGFEAARHNYAIVLYRQQKIAAALTEVLQLLAADPNNPGYQNLQAAILTQLGDLTESLAVYERVLTTHPHQPKGWMSYGHALKTARRQADSVAAYRRAIAQQPTLGEAYWSLANLKTFRFSDQDKLLMRQALARTDLSDDDRLHFDFALAKALEDDACYAESFAHYAAGNERRRRLTPYSAERTHEHMQRARAVFDSAFFAARAGVGSLAPDPIFVVGLPRAGSTLVEQILASHPLVEGTMELPDIGGLVRELAGTRAADEAPRYPAILATLSNADWASLGERYLAQTRVQRKTDAPFFIDKMPNNFSHVGFIHLILPNAKIIDARRHPLGCCLSAFKQHFARGQNFAYSLSDIGRYYADYVELMAHVDGVLPGRVHRVIYERMVEDTEVEVRRLLDYCGLPFDDRCLRFYENDRAVRTASSEQVRRPINREGMDQWRHYEPWLGPLKDALGPVLASYPNAPTRSVTT